ncbi:MAG: hypothetical protein I8H73_06125 [Pseudomonadales bacterium]|nr:hypothetical protein [Pseudomonadales bacterium]
MAILIIFFAAWAAFAMWANGKKLGITAALGGGFIIALLSLFPAIYAGKYLDEKYGPESVQAAPSAIASVKTADFYTDTEASGKAKALLKDAYSLQSEIAHICSNPGAASLLYIAADKAGVKLKEWPNDHLKYRALFPYYACRQLMVDVQSYAFSCATGGYKGEAASYNQRRSKEDGAECEAAILKPDLSLKEIE